MTDQTPAEPGPGWWKATDGGWYPPELHPDFEKPLAEDSRVGGDSAHTSGRFGSTIEWGWQALTANYGLAVATTGVLLLAAGAGFALVSGLSWFATRFGSQSASWVTTPFNPAIILALIAVGLAGCLLLWDHAAGMTRTKDYTLDFGVRRIAAVIGVLILLLPVALLPLTGGFILVALHLAMGGQRGTIGAISEAVSRVTGSAASFARMLLVGLILSVYAFATAALIALASPGVFLSSTSTAGPLVGFAKSSGGAFVVVVVAVFALIVALLIAAGFFQFLGFATAAWTRQLAGEPLLPPSRSARPWQAAAVVITVAVLSVAGAAVASFVIKDDWVPRDFEQFSDDFAYRFVEPDSPCFARNGCYFVVVETPLGGQCRDEVEVTIDERTEEGEALGTSKGTAPGGFTQLVVIESSQEGGTKAAVEDIRCI
jgi:hypothetical protein